MRPLTRALLGAAVALALAVVPTAATAAAQPQDSTMKLAIPAYFDPPSSYWTQLDAGAPTVGVVIANLDNGPGTAPSADYVTAISNAHAAGIKVIGYVDTGYFGVFGNTTRGGKTTTAAWTTQIESDVDSWYSWYGSAGLSGILFDEALNDCGTNNAHVDLYETIRDHVKTESSTATVFDNFGTGTDQCYTQAADTLVTFEGTYADYASYQPPAWEATANPGQLSQVVFDTAQSQLDSTVALARSRNVGYLYVTPDNLPNPWDTLPTGSYWTQELTDIAG